MKIRLFGDFKIHGKFAGSITEHQLRYGQSNSRALTRFLLTILVTFICVKSAMERDIELKLNPERGVVKQRLGSEIVSSNC